MTKKKLYIIFGVVVFAIAAVVGVHYTVRIAQRNSDMVYVCTGKYSKAYHCTTHCKGLDNCSGDIVKMDKQTAQRCNRHPCGFCYGKHHK